MAKDEKKEETKPELPSTNKEQSKIDDRVRKFVMVSDGVYKCID